MADSGWLPFRYSLQGVPSDCSPESQRDGRERQRQPANLPRRSEAPCHSCPEQRQIEGPCGQCAKPLRCGCARNGRPGQLTDERLHPISNRPQQPGGSAKPESDSQGRQPSDDCARGQLLRQLPQDKTTRRNGIDQGEPKGPESQAGNRPKGQGEPPAGRPIPDLQAKQQRQIAQKEGFAISAQGDRRVERDVDCGDRHDQPGSKRLPFRSGDAIDQGDGCEQRAEIENALDHSYDPNLLPK